MTRRRNVPVDRQKKDKQKEGAEQVGSFEEELATLEETVDLLERGELPLEDAIRRYEQGFRSLKHCYNILKEAQKKIEVLCEEAGDDLGAAPVFEWKPLQIKGLEESAGPSGGASADDQSDENDHDDEDDQNR